jgi:membrane protease YdiL (CAAX protease family)
VSGARAASLPLGFAVLLVLAGGIAAQLGGAMTAAIVRAAVAGHDAGSGELDAAPVAVLPAMAMSSLLLLGVAAASPLLFGLPWRAALGLRAQPLRVFAAAAAGTVMLNPLGDALMRAMDAAFPGATLGVLELLHRVAAGAPLFLVWPIFALLPGLSEELMFRGVLQRAAGNGGWAIVLSALSFSLFHADPHHIAGVLPLAFFLAWVATRAGTLVTVVAHVANNTVAILALGSETLSVGYGTERPMPWSWVPLGVGVSLACAWVIWRECRPLNSPAVVCSPSRHAEHRSD